MEEQEMMRSDLTSLGKDIRLWILWLLLLELDLRQAL